MAPTIDIELSASLRLSSSALMPIPCNALAVLLDISRNDLLALVMMSRPSFEKTPLRVCCNMATNSSALRPASFNAGAYCLMLLRKSPFTSAPAAKPLATTSLAACQSRPNWLAMVSTACRVSLKSLPQVSAMACTDERMLFSSAPVVPVNWCVKRIASVTPSL